MTDKDDFALALATIIEPWIQPYPPQVKAAVLEELRQVLMRYEVQKVA